MVTQQRNIPFAAIIENGWIVRALFGRADDHIATNGLERKERINWQSWVLVRQESNPIKRQSHNLQDTVVFTIFASVNHSIKHHVVVAIANILHHVVSKNASHRNGGCWQEWLGNTKTEHCWVVVPPCPYRRTQQEELLSQSETPGSPIAPPVSLLQTLENCIEKEKKKNSCKGASVKAVCAALHPKRRILQQTRQEYCSSDSIDFQNVLSLASSSISSDTIRVSMIPLFIVLLHEIVNIFAQFCKQGQPFEGGTL